MSDFKGRAMVDIIQTISSTLHSVGMVFTVDTGIHYAKK